MSNFYGQYIGFGAGGPGVAAFPSATGGTITTDGDYKIHTFNSSGSFAVTVGTNANVEYLVIAGGGAGGSGGGGSGAGGYRYGTGHTMASQTY